MNGLWNVIDLDVDDVLGAVGLVRRSNAPGVGSFLLGLGVGLVGGAAATLLLTPYSGTETREKLVRAGEDLSRTVQTKAKEIASKRTNGGTESLVATTTDPYSANRIGSV